MGKLLISVSTQPLTSLTRSAIGAGSPGSAVSSPSPLSSHASGDTGVSTAWNGLPATGLPCSSTLTETDDSLRLMGPKLAASGTARTAWYSASPRYVVAFENTRGVSPSPDRPSPSSSCVDCSNTDTLNTRPPEVKASPPCPVARTMTVASPPTTNGPLCKSQPLHTSHLAIDTLS
eukprot:scaffold205821_cov24-Prasinocladus_malaysianus.AAC.1